LIVPNVVPFLMFQALQTPPSWEGILLTLRCAQVNLRLECAEDKEQNVKVSFVIKFVFIDLTMGP